jgi:hypothetical protein
MNAKIVFLRDNVAMPARRKGPVGNFKSQNRFDIRRIAQPDKPVREVLVAVWRVNPASGRPECRWTTERAAATDEGVSRSEHLRQAA